MHSALYNKMYSVKFAYGAVNPAFPYWCAEQENRAGTRIIYSNSIPMTPQHYTVDPMVLPSENPFKCHEEVLYLQPLIPPKRFDIFFPPDWGMLRRSRRVLIFLYKTGGQIQPILEKYILLVVVVVFTLKAVPVSTPYFLTSVLVQLTRTPSVVTG